MVYFYLMISEQFGDVAQHLAVQKQGNCSNTVFHIKNLDMMLDWLHLTG